MPDDQMGALAAQDAYDPMTGIPIGAPRVEDPPQLRPWMGSVAAHPDSFTPQVTTWPDPNRKPGDVDWSHYNQPFGQLTDTNPVLYPIKGVPGGGIRQADMDRATDLAMSFSGGGLTFGGKLAQTADLGALARAQEMASKGHYPEQIWSDTGWFRGADDKWRFEIPDAPSKWKTDPRDFAYMAPSDPTIGGAFAHDDLYAAYPQLANADLNVRHLGRGTHGTYQPGIDTGPATISLAPGSPAMMRSTALHELQHGIQDIEGFATGGNTIGLRPRTPAWDIYQERLKAIREPNSRADMEDAGILGPDFTYEDYLKQHADALKNPEHVRMLDREAQETAVQEAYRRLAGEVEARNVQKRADKPPGELRDIPPSFTQDYPNQQQIVKFRTGD